MTNEKEARLRELISEACNYSFDCGQFDFDEACDENPMQRIESYLELAAKCKPAREAIVSFVKDNCGLSGYVHMPQEKHAELLAKIEATEKDNEEYKRGVVQMADRMVAMGRLLDGVEHLNKPIPGARLASACPSHCPRCAWEKMKHGNEFWNS